MWVTLWLLPGNDTKSLQAIPAWSSTAAIRLSFHGDSSMMPSSESDDDLLLGIRADDDKCLQRLLRRYYPRLVDFGCSIHRDREMADEAVSNVFLNIWRRREKIRITSSIRAYLFSAVLKQMLNLKRQGARRVEVTMEEVGQHELVDHQNGQSDLRYRELADQVQALLEKMPRRRQLVFRMNRIEGLKYLEIADALGISEHTVQNHMVQAMKQLAKELPEVKETLSTSSSAPF